MANSNVIEYLIEAIQELVDLRKMASTKTVLEVQHVMLTSLCSGTIIFTRDQLRERFMILLLHLIPKVFFSFFLLPFITDSTLLTRHSKCQKSWFPNLIFDYLFFYFRDAWRVNLCPDCLFGSRSRKSTFSFPSK